MIDRDRLTQPFEESRSHLRAVAYRMLGSASEADDAVQEAWLRLHRADTAEIENLRAWLTTVVARVCLDMLRARKSRREDSLDDEIPPAAEAATPNDPEREAVLADSVGLALLVVLDTLAPAERLAFVLHDMFAVPFEEIAPIVGRSPAAARQLASRARRRVRGASARREVDVRRQREIVSAFLTALRAGDFEGLLAVLDPDVVVRLEGDAAGAVRELRGAATWASGAVAYSRLAKLVQLALVNGEVGLVMAAGGRLSRALQFTLENDRIVRLEIIADPARLRDLEVAVLEGPDEPSR